jgi:acyl-CoA thioesterase-1
LGLSQPELVASDGLHPSELAYSKFVERILPKTLLKLEN